MIIAVKINAKFNVDNANLMEYNITLEEKPCRNYSVLFFLINSFGLITAFAEIIITILISGVL